MTFTDTINSLRVWGIKGAINFARRWPVLRRLKNSDKHVWRSPQRGITLIGPFSAHNGNSHTMRNLAQMLRNANIPFQTFDTNYPPSLPPGDYKHLITPFKEFDLGHYSHVIELFTQHSPVSPNRVHALLAFWEYESGFDFAFPSAATSGLPIVAMSDFNAKHFRTILPKDTPVFKIRHPLILNPSEATSPDVLRARYCISTTTFIVFFNFDYGSSYYRKNPEAVVKAFAKAFTPSDNAVLLLKTSNAKRHRETEMRLRSVISTSSLDQDRIIIIDDALSQSDMSGLFHACDVYISLHRGEGFGIGMAEAMACGKPVIATNYSANTEFCTDETSIPVPYKMTSPSKAEIDNPAYSHVTSWAEPDIDFAASALAKCYKDRNFAKQIGSTGAAFIKKSFSLENFKQDINAFLDESPIAAAMQ